MGTKLRKTKHACQECGHIAYQWLGRCPSCGQWNTFVEEQDGLADGKTRQGSMDTILRSLQKKKEKVKALHHLKAESHSRLSTGIGELDRVLGGGAVEGAFVLIGGEPGIGKSTLLIQVLEKLSQQQKVLYVTGEESPSQVKLRAERLGLRGESLLLVAETSLESILRIIEKEQPNVLAIDSIQTIHTSSVESAPGSVSQVREVGARLMHLAKNANILTLIVGHVTKEGAIAGPRVLEHMVDTVLYFESTTGGNYRILRSVKNRFGSTNEVGIFEMRDVGLIEVKNPSALFLEERSENAPGSVVVSSLEGTRPLLVELQSLVAQSYLPAPRRTTLGVDYNRVALLVAVLEKKWELRLGGQDIYVNAVGGVRLTEPSIDLGIMAAVASSFLNKVVSKDYLFIGEVGLSGEVRGVRQVESRLKEAQALGFKKCFLPESNYRQIKKNWDIIELFGVRHSQSIMEVFESS